MIPAKVYRIGKYPKINRELKGGFVKEFNTIEELVKFMYDNRNRLAVHWKHAVPTKMWGVVLSKYKAMCNKRSEMK